MFDVIVIGAGSGGLTVALGLAGLEKKVLLIEKHKMGGDCTNYGCIPSKSLIKYGKEMAVLKKFGIDVEKKVLDQSMKYAENIVNEILDHESPEALEKNYKSLKVVKGEARFVDKKLIVVNGKTYRGKKIVIATGSEPRVIKVEGLKKDQILTNKSVFDLKEIPTRLLIIGGGVIACELGEAFANLGSEVHLIVRGDMLLGKSNTEVSDFVKDELEAKGVKIHFRSSIEKVEGQIAYVGKEKIELDRVLMAVGRVVDVDNLDLEKAGVKHDKNGILVNDKNKTSTRGIYAVGDVCSRDKLTHNADHQGRNVVKDILLPFSFASKKAMPKVVYMENEVASVGMTYEEAVDKHSENQIFKIVLDFDRVDRSKTEQTSGKAVFVVKGLRGKILGAEIVGPHAGEMIGVVVQAIDNKISLHKLSSSIFAYPTYSRIFKKAGDDYLRAISAEWKTYAKNWLKDNALKFVAALFWATLIYGFFWYKDIYDKTNLEIAKDFFNYFSDPDLTTVGIYILVYTLRPLILFPGTLLTVLSGALFGPIVGIAATTVGANMSASVAYGAGRFLGGDLIGDESSFLGKWKKRLKDRSFESVMIMRLIYLPFDGVNYGCGILKVKWVQYMLATFLGTLPGIATFVFFGASVDFANFDASMIELKPELLAVSGVLFVSSLVLARVVRSRHGVEKPATS